MGCDLHCVLVVNRAQGVRVNLDTSEVCVELGVGAGARAHCSGFGFVDLWCWVAVVSSVLNQGIFCLGSSVTVSGC